MRGARTGDSRVRLRRILLLIIGIFGGAFVGRVATHQVGGLDVYPLDSTEWRIISPGLSEAVGPAGAGRITHVVAGALTITEHVFFRPDTVMPQLDGMAHTIEVDLAKDSATLRLRIGALPGVFVHLTPTHFMVPQQPGVWSGNQANGAYRFSVEGNRLMLDAGGDPVMVSTIRPGGLELSTEGGQARIRRIRVEDASGTPLLDEDFGSWPTSADSLTKGTLLGGFTGCLAALLAMGAGPAAWLMVSVFLALPLGVLMLDHGIWLAGVERLYLKHLSPSDLARSALVLSVLPLVAGVMVRLVRHGWQRLISLQVPNVRQGWLIATVCAIVLGLNTSSDLGLFSGLLCVAYAGLWGVRSFRQAPDAWWLFDLPAAVSVAVLGTGMGLLGAVSWRLIVGVATAAWWIGKGPRMAVDLLLLGGLIALPVLEIAVQETPLDVAWDSAQLRLERPNEKGWRDPVPGWTGRCGPSEASTTKVVVVAGGSSVGGAYQFGGEPEAFFTAQAHEAMCEKLPADTALVTHNFGWGDRNTFTIAHTIDSMLKGGEFRGLSYPQPHVMVLYVGVNDLLTQHNALTRKQREEKMESRGDAAQGLAAIGRRSRLVTGTSLLVRHVPDPNGAMVPDVPLKDAQENHETIARAMESSGGHLLLITEYIQSDLSHELAGYRSMQTNIASKHEEVSTFPMDHVFDSLPSEQVLLDRNHLTREGNRMLGLALAEQLRMRLGFADAPE